MARFLVTSSDICHLMKLGIDFVNKLTKRSLKLTKPTYDHR